MQRSSWRDKISLLQGMWVHLRPRCYHRPFTVSPGMRTLCFTSRCGAVTACVGLAKHKLGGEARKRTPTLHLLTNSSAFSTFTPNQSLNGAHTTKAQYVSRRSASPLVGSDVKLRTQSARRTSKEVVTNRPSSFWFDFRNITRPCRSKRVKSPRRIARVIKAVYVTIICGVSNSDSYMLWRRAGVSGKRILPGNPRSRSTRTNRLGSSPLLNPSCTNLS